MKDCIKTDMQIVMRMYMDEKSILYTDRHATTQILFQLKEL